MKARPSAPGVDARLRPRRSAARASILALVQAAALALAGVAAAQERVDPETQKHFDIANSLYGERRYADALVEYDAAYEKSRNFKILYNRGNCLVMLKREPEAIETFERYLEEGGDRVPEDRRAKVRADIDDLKLRLGSISLQGAPSGAEVVLDGRVVGRTPLAEPLSAGAGTHELTVRWSAAVPGWAAEVKVVAGARVVAKVHLAPPPGTPTPLDPSNAAPPVPPPDDGGPPVRRAPRPPGGLYAPALTIAGQVGGSSASNDAGIGTPTWLASGELSLGWRISPFLEIGAFGALARGSYDLSAAPSGLDANAGYGFGTYGLRGRMHLVRGEGYDGWFGVDLGRFVETWTLKNADGGGKAFSVDASATLFALGVGLDVPIGRAIALGGVARFLTASPGGPSSSDCAAGRDCVGSVFTSGFSSTRGFFELGLRVVWSIPLAAPTPPPAPSAGSSVAALPGPGAF